MNTIKEITEADVIEWLANRAENKRIECGLGGKVPVGVSVRVGEHNRWVHWDAHANGECGIGDSFTKACQMLSHRLSKESILCRAESKRNQAAKLLAEADALVPLLVVQDKEGAA